MKTDTRARMVELVSRFGGRRPSELSRDLGITPQAVHRHLRNLVAAGELEVRGRGPLARYFVAGAPAFDAARRWYCSRVEPKGAPEDLLCAARDAFAARQARLVSLDKAGLSEADLPLVVAVAGEVGNNSFDHNLGHWRDVPGCWLETLLTGRRLWICIADRGRGVLDSLSTTLPQLKDDAAALKAAFERNVSGRAPEKRGNGLKFVRGIIAQGPGRGLACRSGSAVVQYGDLGADCLKELDRWAPNAGGAATLVAWSLR